MSGPFGSSQWMYNAGGGFYDFPITNSVRFNDDDSAYLSRTPNASNRRTWTWSGWVKRSTIATSNQNCFFGAWADDNNRFKMNFYQDKIEVVHVSGGTSYNFKITQLFRDVSAWYHIVLAVDTTQGTDTNRYKIYINGEQVTAFDNVSYPAQNFDGAVNSAIEHTHGESDGSANYLDGYLAEVNFIDGTALTPASFGELKNDIWIPKNTSGLTFGSQGFRLQFKQSGTGTASTSTIGADTSGNNNHWTSNNLVASDVVPDSPTNNWCVMNALDARASYGLPTLSEGNLKFSNAGISTSWGFRATSFELTSGKWWGECRVSGNTSAMVGIFNTGGSSGLSLFGTQNPMNNTGSFQMFMDGATTTKFRTGSTDVATSFEDFNDGDVVGLALDVDNETCKWYVNGSIQSNIGTKDVSISGNAKRYVMTALMSDSTASTFVWNFGQDSTFAGAETAAANQDENGLGNFHHAVPSGYLSICSANLPNPVAAIDPAQGGSPQDYFNTVLYTGTGSNLNVTGLGFQPDWIWIKSRSDGSAVHMLTDSVRGNQKTLNSNSTNAEEGHSTKITAFGTDGFSIGTHSHINTNTETYASWNWKAGTAFSNDASATGIGSIDSAGSVNTDVGFSIISYTGNGSNGATVAHGLGVSPDMIIAKTRDSAENWQIFHSALGGTKRLYFLTNAEADTAEAWNDTNPSATVITLGTSNLINKNTDEYIAYCFAEVEGYSKVGSSYTGNGNTDGPFVYTGFRPAFVMLKRTDSTGGWHIHDNKRNTGNLTETMAVLSANLNDGEYASVNYQTDFLSNGFKLRNTTAAWNANGGTFIYMAFAEQPFKYANAR